MAFRCIHATITYEQFKLLMKGLNSHLILVKKGDDVLKLSREVSLGGRRASLIGKRENDVFIQREGKLGSS
jgi:hypothetical protein